jgi:PAS domain S-box-containing protein
MNLKKRGTSQNNKIDKLLKYRYYYCKMSEQELKLKAKGKAMDLWSSRSLCLCLVNQYGEPKAITPGAFRFFGRKEPDQPFPALTEFVHPEDRTDFQEFLGRLASENREIPAHHFRLVNSAGRIIAVRIEGERFDTGTEELLLLHLHERDPLSDQPGSGAFDLESFQATAESMLESLVDGAFVVDINGRIIMVNETLLELLGMRRYEFVGMPVGILFAAEQPVIEKATARFGRIMKYGKIKEMNTDLIVKTGAKVPVSLTGAVIRSRGNELLGILAVVKDMREDRLFKELEQKNIELEKAYAELQDMDAMKDDLLSLVGHELRAPLSNILGYSEFLQEEDLSQKDTEEFSRIIYQESRRLSRLVNDILDLSRMERGKLTYHYLKDNLNEVVKRGIQVLESALREKELDVELSLDKRIPTLEFDPDRIQQVVVNILDNAIKFSDPGKKLEVKTQSRQGEALVSIADQGIGIADEDAEKVFSKFGQIEDLRKHSSGSGLGMPIAKRIIEEGHGGRMWFESPGREKGTTFYFTLPEGERE